MDPFTVETLIKTAKSHWESANDIEITLEANPGSVDNENLPQFFAAGVNRLSLGVQSLNPLTLQFLGRKHTIDQAYQALEIAHKIFPRLTFDLMYALPNQSLEEWRTELKQALSFIKGHLSVYQLTIEEGTQFYHAHQRGQFILPSNEQAGAFYELTQRVLEEAHLSAYEISNHAYDQSHQSRHNLAYWRYEDYVGIGPGAHGRITLNGQRFATRDWKVPEKWLQEVNLNHHGLQEKIPVNPNEAALEALMMGLRLTEGINLQQWNKKSLAPLETIICLPMVENLIKERYLWRNTSSLGATLQGRQRLNAVLQKILQ
jgi:oxygen-independent coproporphyrinogen-3 oxidase